MKQTQTSDPAAPGERELFFEALTKTSENERNAFLDGACYNRSELRQRVAQLLAEHFQKDGVLGKQAVEGPETIMLDLPAEETTGAVIGRYKLLEKLGEGGCGVVYVAEQKEPVRRKVALKVIKLGMDTRQVVARFEAERQALAMMDHPNIAKVLDAGTTDAGRPFFVMELVRGIRITEYCDRANLSTRERLDLFIKVCHAIQHAHQKGIIHRDIKPSNILVTLHDGVPAPKVIDFGIAKATQGELTDKTIHTQFQQFIGTPAYMSPEQADMSGLDIDTRSDIYSLGVLLYELLAGGTPFDAKELMSGGIDSMRKIIQEKEPMRPSTKLSQTLETIDQAGRVALGAPSVREGLSTSGAQGVTRPPGEEEVRADSRRLLRVQETIRQLKGDLDWIVMKCLEKDRQRRYDTANGLAADLKRHIDNEPVLARPPSAAYKFQKAFRRNKLAFAAGTAVVGALVVGLALAAMGWRETGLERDKALQAQNLAVAAQREAVAAQQKAEESQRSEMEQRQRAEQGEAHASRMLYAANMNLAQQAWHKNDVGWLRELLNETRESAGRGFEWYYWQRQAHLELKALRGHLEEVTSVAFSPDGQRIVTGSKDGTARVWEAGSGRELLTLEGHSAGVSSVAFSPDGQRIVTGSWDKTARVWEAASGRELLTLKGHVQGVSSVASSPDGQRIVTGSEDQAARVWEAAGGRELLTLKGHFQGVSSVAFSPDGQRIITGSRDKTARVWEAASGRELLTIEGHFDKVLSVAFSPDGQRIVTGSSDKTARVWEAASGRELLTFKGHVKAVSSVAFSPDGQRILTGSWDKKARVWEAAGGRELLTIEGHLDEVRFAAFSPDGQRIVTGGEDPTVKVWEAANDRELLTLKGHGHKVLSVAFSPDGQRIVTGSSDRTARVWEAASGRQLLTLKGHVGPVWSVAFSPDGQRIVTGGQDPTVKVWEAASGRELLTLDLSSPGVPSLVLSAAFSPDGQRIVTGSAWQGARVWGAVSGRKLLTLKDALEVRFAAFSPDGQRIVTSGGGPTVKVWEAASGRELLTLKEARTAGPVAFSPDGQRIVTGSRDKTARVWEAASGRELLTLKGHDDQVWSVAFSPDGQRIVTGSGDQTARVWEAASGRELLTLKGHFDEVLSVAFSQDGQRIVTGSQDQTARVWEAATPQQVAAWQVEEQTAGQRLAERRAAVEAGRAADGAAVLEAIKAAEAKDRELAALSGRPETQPKHQTSARERPLQPGDPGAIRQWLMLAPLPFRGDLSLNTLRQQLPNEARLRPRAGERPPEAPAGLAWTPVRLSEDSYRLDFGSLVTQGRPGPDAENQIAYAVAYIVSESPQTGLMLLAGSDETARIYLNEREIYRQLDGRSFRQDNDEVSGVALKAGVNVLVFKVGNGTGDWEGSVRLLDAAGQPVQGIQVTLDPDQGK